MKSPTIISYEQWCENVIAFCIENGLEYSFFDPDDTAVDVVDVSKPAYESQKRADIKLWTETVTK